MLQKDIFRFLFKFFLIFRKLLLELQIYLPKLIIVYFIFRYNYFKANFVRSEIFLVSKSICFIISIFPFFYA